MKVEQLIAILEKYPPNTDVRFFSTFEYECTVEHDDQELECTAEVDVEFDDLRPTDINEMPCLDVAIRLNLYN